MDWLILFVVSWTIFILLVDWKGLKVNIWGGVMAMLLQQIVDTQAMEHGLYLVRNVYVNIKGSSLFFIIGPVLTVGILLAQYHPRNRRYSIINMFILALLYTLEEVLLLNRGDVVYTNWHFIDSIQANIIAIIILSWFARVILKKERRDYI